MAEREEPTPAARRIKRYCKTLELKNDPALMQAYQEAHSPMAVWPEIRKGMQEVGILDMQIYRDGYRLFMIMDTVPDFDHDRAMDELAGKPRQAEWEERMSRFQAASAEATAGEKWKLMERIYSMEEPAGTIA
jgi:L-rhamnose mutarotase